MADAVVAAQKVLCGRVAQGDDEQRSDEPDLGHEPIRAGVDLASRRHTVVRRTTLDDVGDEHVVAVDLHRIQDFGKFLACLAHERTPRPVLRLTGALPDEHEVSLRMPLAEHHVRARVRQRALLANARILGQPLQAQLQSLPFQHDTPQAGGPSRQTLRHTQPLAQPSARRHRRTIVSPPPLDNHRPSGLKATPRTEYLSAFSVATGSSAGICHQ